ncbi:enoyl-CoA hydratase/isomerase family protein [Flavihumibacter profundi]|uniref:enoyl-CoA hydratase/isomerase family protein n=1 Tax=Flavihumibacter profundi TaxID=2716883 RepID=UPI001CC4529C|nr:enoyl-CoA hydratase-related protein [Flavihumibacter profundi]MBZ5858468.1 enoyl-CoA hydratase/isomerase family protein [Flavihumibacter profundi]
MYTTILTSLQEQILTITINRPDKLNALNKTVIEELGQIMVSVYTDDTIKAAIITGAGPKSFVAGADISEFLELDGSGGQGLAKKGQDLVFNKIENCPKPIIAAVNGFALGGGCELAMACHFRLASESAKFGQPEVNLGLVPGYGGTQRLTQLVGKGKAMELMMTGAIIDATEAKSLGLVNHVTSPDELLPKTTQLLKTIISKAPLAIAKIISLTNLAAIGHPDGLELEVAAFGELFDSADAKEGARAFLEKRPASFKGI